MFSLTCVISNLDINECLTINPSPCSCGVRGEPCGANCTNLVPGYACSCAQGFRVRSGGTVCDGNVSAAVNHKSYCFSRKRFLLDCLHLCGVVCRCQRVHRNAKWRMPTNMQECSREFFLCLFPRFSQGSEEWHPLRR